jgi:osmotically-inducible protein OsmY
MTRRLGLVIGAGWLLGTSGRVVGQQASGADEAAVEQQIRADLQHNPDLENDVIEVTVDGAVATLWGVVGTASERAKAERIARSDGAAAVDNHLKVVNPRAKKPR